MMEPMPAKTAVWLVLAEIQSITSARDPDCQECHHCPYCCGACDAVAWAAENWPELGRWIARNAGTGWPWLDGEKIEWDTIAKVWGSRPCPEGSP